MSHVKYFWDEEEDNVVREYDAYNNTLASYTTEPTLYGSVLSQDRGGEKRHFHFDGLGNTAELTDQAGNVTDTRRYSAFGDITGISGTTSTPFGFGARWGYHSNSAPSLSIVRRRNYHSVLTRWMSPDPLSITIAPQSSPFAFVNNCPVITIDPSGLIAIELRDRFMGRSQTAAPVVPPAPAAGGFLSWPSLGSFGLTCLRTVPLAVVLKPAYCLYLERVDDENYKARPLNAAESRCVDIVLQLLPGPVVYEISIAGCPGKMKVRMDGGPTETSCRVPCMFLAKNQGAVTYWDASDIDCTSCKGVVAFIATLIHECKHHRAAFCEDEEATIEYELSTLKHWRQRICTELVSRKVCRDSSTCYLWFDKEIDKSEDYLK